MLRKDTRVAAPVSTSLSHPLARYPGGFAVDKRGEVGVPREIRERCTATREDVLLPAAPPPRLPPSYSTSRHRGAHSRIPPAADFPLSFDGRTREWIGSTASAEGERLEEGGGGGGRIRVSAEKANASRRNASTAAPR